MKILLIMDPGISIPPIQYGGHERLVYMFAEEYTRLGHDVCLLAGPDSKITGKVYSFGVNNLKRSKYQKFKELLFAWKFLILKKNKFDLIHNFGRLAYLLPILNTDVNKIMSYGREIDSKNISIVNKLTTNKLKFTAPSYDCISTAKNIGDWTRVFNAIDFTKYDLTENLNADAPLIYLGRLDKVKGCHIAIEVAKATNSKLIIAGNISTELHEIEYFDQKIKPHIDNKTIVYVGAVNDEEKNYYLGLSKALLFPINVREAFGMVMVESMACGTPVIGFNMGAVSEVITNGITGFIVESSEEMSLKLKLIDSINRRECRKMAKEQFDKTIVAKSYLQLFYN